MKVFLSKRPNWDLGRVRWQWQWALSALVNGSIKEMFFAKDSCHGAPERVCACAFLQNQVPREREFRIPAIFRPWMCLLESDTPSPMSLYVGHSAAAHNRFSDVLCSSQKQPLFSFVRIFSVPNVWECIYGVDSSGSRSSYAVPNPTGLETHYRLLFKAGGRWRSKFEPVIPNACCYCMRLFW